MNLENRPLISVIVPVYKVEKYLNRCVASIAAQTYENLEIILVDDGSPDGCGVICDNWARKDPRVKVVHKENGGLSSARNAGVAVATGKYVGFVDSDDYIHPQMYEKLYAALTETGADVSICNYDYVDESGAADLQMREISPIKTEVLTREQAYEKVAVLEKGYAFYVTAVNKLYPRSVFEQLQFKEGFVHEDEFFVHHLFFHCSCVATIADPLYFYVQRSGSITKTKATVRSLDGVYAYYDRYEFFRKEGRRKFARLSLQGANWLITDLLYRMDKTSGMEQIRKAVGLVFWEMVRHLDFRVAYLMKSWLLFLRRKE